MDCLCCDGGAGPESDTEFLGSICNLTKEGVPAKFPAEPHRYVMYVIAGCPFAARPWSVMSFYGLEECVDVVKCFPASYEDGWFFQPVSSGEHDLVASFPHADWAKKDPLHGCDHLRQLYEKAKPGFKGVVSVPLMWDTANNTVVSNSSLGLSKMIATQMRHMGTRNTDVALFPDQDTDPGAYKEHDQLVKALHTSITTVVYKINGTKCGKEHDRLVDAYYSKLDELQERIRSHGPYLMGKDIYFADIVLFISLVRLDLAYQWRFGLGRRSVRDNYKVLWAYMKHILELPGISETILPRDIMALYFLSLKWVKNAGRTLPQVPETWESGCLGKEGPCSMTD